MKKHEARCVVWRLTEESCRMLVGELDSDYIYPVGLRGSHDIMTADDKVVSFSISSQAGAVEN